MDLHHFDDETQKLADRITQWTIDRMKEDPPPLNGTPSQHDFIDKLNNVITPEGLGPEKAFNLFENVIDPSMISLDHPRFLAFVPNAPANAASLFDLVVSASSIFGGTWLEGGAGVAAENQALRFLSDLIGFPQNAGGVFVSGGTAANLSALMTARHYFRSLRPELKRTRLAIACTQSVHSSITQAAYAMDVDVLTVPSDDMDRLTGENFARALTSFSTEDRERLFAVAASAGTTNSGYVDDLDGVGTLCNENDIWFHVDGAYGGAGILCEKTAPLFTGVEKCDTFVIDPHKWLFSPYDCAALIYKDPSLARETHTQHAAYLDSAVESSDWNPSDYAHHLSRRARGLPFWFTLAVHGTQAIADAVSQCMETTYAGADLIRQSSHLELIVEPQLSVLLFRRKGWDRAQYKTWCQSMIEKEFAFIEPTIYESETVLRLCLVNPTTTNEDIQLIVDSLA